MCDPRPEPPSPTMATESWKPAASNALRYPVCMHPPTFRPKMRKIHLQFFYNYYYPRYDDDQAAPEPEPSGSEEEEERQAYRACNSSTSRRHRRRRGAELSPQDKIEVARAMKDLDLHLEVLKTTQAEIFDKLEKLKRDDPLIKYMKKVINLLKKDVKAFQCRLDRATIITLSRKTEELTDTYEALKLYFKDPKGKDKQWIMDYIHSIQGVGMFQ